MATISREQMVAEIRAGRSILFNPTDGSPGGTQATKVEDLPSEAALAEQSGDPAKVRSARDAIDAQIRALQQVRDNLRVPPADPEPPKVEAAAVNIPLGPGRVDVPLDPPKAEVAPIPEPKADPKKGK